MAEQRTRRQPDAEPAECRYPEGWPQLLANFVTGSREWRHNLAECGLEPTPDGERPS